MDDTKKLKKSRNHFMVVSSRVKVHVPPALIMSQKQAITEQLDSYLLT